MTTPTRLSATGIAQYQACPAMFKANFIDRVPNLSGEHAGIGTACHGALEDFVKQGFYQLPDPLARQLALQNLFDMHYRRIFGEDRRRFDDGVVMLDTWIERQNWTGRTVLSTELKETFELPLSTGPILVTYIWDRCDQVEVPGDPSNFDIEVIDYKTIAWALEPAELKFKTQPRLYALAAKIKYPTARRIKVTFDQLRHEPISITFDRDDCVAIWNELKRAGEEIVADTEYKERLNPECRWCVRKLGCKTFDRHAQAGGVLKISDPKQAADLRDRYQNVIAGLNALVNDLDQYLLRYCSDNDIYEIETDETLMNISASKRRIVDPARVAQFVDRPIFDEYGEMKLTLKDFDRLCKDPRIPDETRSLLRQLVQYSFGDPKVKTTAKKAGEVE